MAIPEVQAVPGSVTTTLYVDADNGDDGDDGSQMAVGEGTVGPKATVDAAYDALFAATGTDGDAIIYLKAGTTTDYGSMTIDIAFSDWVFILKSGAGALPVIKGAENAAIRHGNTCNKLQFREIDIQAPVQNCLLLYYDGRNLAGLEFVDCTFTSVADNENRHIVTASDTCTGTYTGLIFKGCTFTNVNTQATFALNLQFVAAGSSEVTLDDCTVTSTTHGVTIDAQILNVRGGSYTADSDGQCALSTTLESVEQGGGVIDIQGVKAHQNGTSHVFRSGIDQSGTIADCVFTGGDYGLVTEDSAAIDITGNVCSGASAGGIYLAGSNGATPGARIVKDNVVIQAAGLCLQAGIGNVYEVAVRDCTVTNNVFIQTGANADIFYILTDKTGANYVTDYNICIPAGASSNFGAIKADANCLTLTEVTAAWGDTNESHSGAGLPFGSPYAYA